jgi:Uma2 family endonuclease
LASSHWNEKGTYERAGLAELWLVDSAARTILVYRRSTAASTAFEVALEIGEDEILTTPLLPEFTLDITELFTYADR